MPLANFSDALEPMEISMALPSQQSRGGQSEACEKIRAMEVSTTQAVFFKCPAGTNMKKFRSRIRGVIQGVMRFPAAPDHKDRKYAMRTVKSGVIPGIGVWRTK